MFDWFLQNISTYGGDVDSVVVAAPLFLNFEKTDKALDIFANLLKLENNDLDNSQV